VFLPLFSYTGLLGLKSEIINFEGRKTGIIIPFWLADRLSDGLEATPGVTNRKKACFWVPEFLLKPIKKPTLLPL